MDDSRIMELLYYENGEDMYEEIDMGQLDEEEKQYLIVDKDSGKVYDIRNERHLQRISDRSITKINTEPTQGHSSTSDSQILKPKAWSDWWKDKRKNDQDFLASAENGDLKELRRLLDEDTLLDLAADVNVKGLDQWTALHFAANEGQLEIV